MSQAHAGRGPPIKDWTCRMPGAGLPSTNWATGKTCFRLPLRSATTSLRRCHECNVDRGMPKCASRYVGPAIWPAHCSMRAQSFCCFFIFCLGRDSNRLTCAAEEAASRSTASKHLALSATNLSTNSSANLANSSSIVGWHTAAVSSAAIGPKVPRGEFGFRSAITSSCRARRRCTSVVIQLERSSSRRPSVVFGFIICAPSATKESACFARCRTMPTVTPFRIEVYGAVATVVIEAGRSASVDQRRSEQKG